MRYIGNKESLTETIKDVIVSKCNINRDTVFFDALCGMGSVANAFKGECELVINDSLSCATTFTTGRIVASSCIFSDLEFDPFSFLNNSKDTVYGFFYNNYSPGGSNRMYFTPQNAARIDFFRETIETWKSNNLINENEYRYLLACLLESVSAVSNTAGVYGAFLKEWDARALKDIVFIDIDDGTTCVNGVSAYSDRIEEQRQCVLTGLGFISPTYFLTGL